jgi:2-isopropylmalate synthase
VQPNKAIVGANAFSHESGIHQDGMLKNRNTYEIMGAELVGIAENSLVLGKHSGRAAFRSRLVEMGYEGLSEEDLQRSFTRFKELADKKKEVSSYDIESIVNDEIQFDTKVRFVLENMQVVCGASTVPTATVSNTVTTRAATGTGPVDAAFKSLVSILGDDDIVLLEYSVDSVTAGIDALGEVTVRIQDAVTSRVFYGRSSNSDILTASTQVLTAKVNCLPSALRPFFLRAARSLFKPLTFSSLFS